MLLKKFRGCLMGALLGDCFGAPYEGDLAYTISKIQLQAYFDRLEGPSYKTPLYKYTDDTAMTKSVAESLLQHNGFNAQDMASKFVTEYFKEPRRGYGENVVDVFHKLNRSSEDVWKPAAEQFRGTGSFGNGGAMRIAPVPLFAVKDSDLMLQIAEKVTKLTHTHPQGVNGALLQAMAIQLSLSSNPDEKLDTMKYLNQLVEKISAIEQNSKKIFQDEVSYTEQLGKVQKLLEFGENAIIESVIEELGTSTAAIFSVPTAIYCFLRAQQPIKNIETESPFRRTLQYAISLGGDTDTIASMAGAIAGAYYGIEAVNENALKLAEASDLMNSFATKLYEVVSR